MDHQYSGLMRTALALAVAAMLAAGAAACGSDDENGGGGSAKAEQASTTRSGGDPNGTPDERIRATYDELVDAMYASQAQKVCGLLSAKAEKALARKSSCAKRLGDYLERQGTGLNPDRPRAVSVTIRGQRALVRAKTRKSNVYTIPFVKAGREWQVDGGFETAGL